jgi:hypothetical protein
VKSFRFVQLQLDSTDLSIRQICQKQWLNISMELKTKNSKRRFMRCVRITRMGNTWKFSGERMGSEMAQKKGQSKMEKQLTTLTNKIQQLTIPKARSTAPKVVKNIAKPKRKRKTPVFNREVANLVRTLATPNHSKAEGSKSTTSNDSAASGVRASIDLITDATGSGMYVFTANPLCSAFALQGSIAGKGVNPLAVDRSGNTVPMGQVPVSELAARNAYRVVSAGLNFKSYTPDLNNGGKVAIGTTEVISMLPLRQSYFRAGILSALPTQTLMSTNADYSLVADFIYEAFGCADVSEIDLTEMHQRTLSVDDSRNHSLSVVLKPTFGCDRMRTFYNLRSITNNDQYFGAGGYSPYDSLGFDICLVQLSGCSPNTVIATIESVIHMEYHETVKRANYGVTQSGRASGSSMTRAQIDAAHDIANSQPSIFHDLEEEAMGAGGAIAAPSVYSAAASAFGGEVAEESFAVEATELVLPVMEEALPFLALML